MPRAPRSRWFGVSMLVLGSTTGTIAAADADAGPPPSEPTEARQFDFWIGDWEVVSPSGVLQGTNRIEQIANGRGLLELWSGAATAGNGNGRSLNAWNSEKRLWQQFWIGSDGTVLELSGGLIGRSMVLTGKRMLQAVEVLERIS